MKNKSLDDDKSAAKYLDDHEEEALLAERNSEKVHLLEDLLATDFPKARILNFACNSNWLVDAPVKTTKEIGDCLLEQIKRTRPIQVYITKNIPYGLTDDIDSNAPSSLLATA